MMKTNSDTANSERLRQYTLVAVGASTVSAVTTAAIAGGAPPRRPPNPRQDGVAPSRS